MITKKELLYENKELKITRLYLIIIIFIPLMLLSILNVIILVLEMPNPVESQNNKIEENNNKTFNGKNISFDFDDLNEKEIFKAKGWINELKPEYASLIKTMKFTKNQSELNWSSNQTIGINRKGDIIILYTGKYNDKQVIFHEILHEIVDLPKKSEEWFVDDLEMCMSAYKDF